LKKKRRIEFLLLFYRKTNSICLLHPFYKKAEDILAIIGTMQRFGFRFLVATCSSHFFSWLLGVPWGTVYYIQQGGREEGNYL
jgi:hypothetical protein